MPQARLRARPLADHPRSYPAHHPAVRVDDTDTWLLAAAARELEAHLLFERARQVADARALLAELYAADGVALEDAVLDAQAEDVARLERADQFLREMAGRLQPDAELLEQAAGADDHTLLVWEEAAASLAEDCPPTLTHPRLGVEETRRGELRSHAQLVRAETQLAGRLRRFGLARRLWHRRHLAVLAGQLADCRRRRQQAERRLALGVGGIPKGRITEIYGPEGAGKTTLALSVIAQAQAAGGSAGYIDTEHALDPRWAATTGVDLARLVLCRPEHGEQALQVASLLIGSGAVAVLVLDSIAALVPRAELAAEIGERLPGVQAHLLSQGLRQLCGPIARSGTAVVVTNQLRQRAGAPGTPVYTAGGRALGYYASVRLDLRRLQALKQDGRVVGSRLRVLVAKNKLGPAGQTAELEVRDDRGVCEPTGRLEDPARAAS